MASFTVSFGRLVTGTELMAAVKAVAETEWTRFRSDHDQADGEIYQIGQVSGYPYDNLIVIPVGDDNGVRPHASYTQVVVRTNQWPDDGGTYMVPYSDDDFVEAVCKFGAELDRHLSGTEAAEKPSVWPQQVTICVLCERIVSRDNPWCSKDGNNPPTRTIQVTPVTD